uniref:Collagen IV NC1 domain-containing protein n=1 Tax=Megaselia scalaris TaxID=36166 RepID=T1GTR1_MEGSC
HTGVGNGGGGQALASPGSCLLDFRATPFIECNGGKGHCHFYDTQTSFWMVTLRESQQFSKPEHEVLKAGNLRQRVSRCSVCIKKSITFSSIIGTMKIIIFFVFALSIQISVALLKCGEKGSGVFDNSNFYPRYKVCTDVTKSETFFTYHVLKPEADTVPNYKRPNWKTKLYENVGTAYNKELQFKNFAELGLPYINGSDSIFFVHFHLTPAGDFASTEDRDSTFYVENGVPGFQKVNNGNWKYIEDQIKSSIKNNAEIITGQFGQLTLTSTSGEKVKLTLESDRPMYKKTPRYDHIKVPEFFYKIVRDTKTKEVS